MGSWHGHVRPVERSTTPSWHHSALQLPHFACTVDPRSLLLFDRPQYLSCLWLLLMCRSNNPQPGDSPPKLERAVEAAAEALSAANPTAGPAVSKLLNGSWALLYSGRSRRLAAAAAFPSSSAAALSLREALQAASDAAYSAFYKYVPVLAGSAVGRARGSSATNLQVRCIGSAAWIPLNGEWPSGQGHLLL